jgi:CHAT domain-containing protein
VRKLTPLPDTAGELREIADSLGADASSIHLREDATETRVKSLDLSATRVIAFTTHGLLAGDLKGIAEPALVLTPPAQGTERDDGLLTASEVAQLKLGAKWVILSACNTAAPDGTPGAEGLAGLAKAFLYAGVRALLVSHFCCADGDHHALVRGDGWHCHDRPRQGTTPLDAGADEHTRQTLLCPSPVLGTLRRRW